MPVTSAPPPVHTPATRAPSAKATATHKAREDAVGSLGQLAQVPLLAMRQYADAGALGQYWPGIAREVATLADSQEQVAQIIDPLIKVGPYAGLITAVLPLVMQIAVNHGRMAPGAMGTVPASMLSAQVETALAQEELRALQAQAEAEKAAAAMRAEIAEQRAGVPHDMPVAS